MLSGYLWLDLLCLRQAGKEAQRLEEWMMDVPTIGHVYNHDTFNARALIYFNGLGRPFYNGSYNDTCHWLRRTWTVQEAVSDPLLGGTTFSS